MFLSHETSCLHKSIIILMNILFFWNEPNLNTSGEFSPIFRAKPQRNSLEMAEETQKKRTLKSCVKNNVHPLLVSKLRKRDHSGLKNGDLFHFPLKVFPFISVDIPNVGFYNESCVNLHLRSGKNEHEPWMKLMFSENCSFNTFFRFDSATRKFIRKLILNSIRR